jgi:hypothetical protein
LERFHYRYLQDKYPLENRYRPGIEAKGRADSLIKLYPQLINPAYFKYLSEKARKPVEEPFKFTVVKRHIFYKEFHRLVLLINSAGYWKMPCKIKCDADVREDVGYILEANTKEKYNFVWSYICPDDKSKFANICQEIIKCAGLDKDINLIWSSRGEQ